MIDAATPMQRQSAERRSMTNFAMRAVGPNDASTRRIVDKVGADMSRRADAGRTAGVHGRTTNTHDPILDAANALRARGHTVEPDDAFEGWLIGGGILMTDAELLVLAMQLGLLEAPRRVQ